MGTTSFAMPGRRQRKKGPNKQRETSTTTFSCWTASKEARREARRSTLSVARSEPKRSCGRLLPTASARPIGWVHKTSLEKLQETEKSLYGWMTSFQIAKLQGADPQDPNFTELEKAAVQGLESRPHEVKA